MPRVTTSILSDVEIAARLQELLGSVPRVDNALAMSPELAHWAGKCSAVMEQYEAGTLISKFGTSADRIRYSTMRDAALGGMLQGMHAALATVEMRLAASDSAGGVFKSGDSHGLFQRLTNYLNLAQHSLYFVDPFSDEVVVDAYLIGMRKKVPIRLLTSNKKDCQARLVAALKHAIPQYGLTVDVRASSETHDRLVFRDETAECLLIGSSVNSAAKKSPSYLAPLDADLAAIKREIYEDVWLRATAVTVS